MEERDQSSVESGSEPQRGRRLGDYQLLHEIGRGGMGVVFKANQISMDRIVAVKMLPSFAGMDASAVARFHREAEIAGRIVHPGIVQVHGVGEEEGVHYYSMELVDGITLYELLESLKSRVPGRLRFSLVEEADLAEEYPDLREPPGRMAAGNRYVRSCVAIAVDVANALAAAHGQRIVHRDLKPSNVMIRDQGRVALLDFGLARDELAVGLTKSGSDPVGTALYMSPEQAAGATDIDARTDIYALGTLLYELLALRPPFVAAHDAEVIRRIREVEPSRLRKFNPQVPVELEAIVHKCLAKDRDDRYPLVEALELELRSFLAGEKLATRSPNPLARAYGSIRRNRRAAGLATGAVLLASLAAGITILGSKHQAEQEGKTALEDARQAVLHDPEDLDLVISHYAQARALLGDVPLLREARVAHFREAFEVHYPEQLLLLDFLFASLSVEKRAALGDLSPILAGRGRLRVDLAGRPLVEMHVRAFRNGQLEEEWQELSAEGELPLGEYLLRVIPPDCLPILQRVQIERDASNFRLIRELIRSEAPPGMQPVLHAAGREGFWIDAEEFSQARLARMLRDLPYSLQQDLDPSGARWQEIDMPARGLSFYQARLIAMLSGGHLPSREEYMQAASAGFALAYPWGNEFDPESLVADPDYLHAPKAVGGQRAGASLYGVRQLLGNIAEYLVPAEDRRLYLAGGHYQSLHPERLRLDRPEDLFEEIAGDKPWQSSPAHAGMRLLRFLPAPDDPTAVARVDAEWEEVRAEAPAYVLHEWELSEDGLLDYRLRLKGIHARARQILSLPFVTQGFLQTDEMQVLDGHGREIDFEHRLAWHGEFSELVIPFAQRVAPGQSYSLELRSQLLGLFSMQLVGDQYHLRLPVKATGSIPVLLRLRLPRGCQLSSFDVGERGSFDSYFVDGQQEIVWKFMPGAEASIRSMPLVVRFRRDGLLTSRWPLWGKAESTTERFFKALVDDDREELARLIHSTYLEMPAGIGRQRRISDTKGLGQYENWRIEDISAVGPVVSVDLRVDWHTDIDSFQEQVHSGWPLRLQLLRKGEALAVIRLGPRSQSDTGRLAEDGSYEHSELKLRIDASSHASLVRGQDQSAELQVSSNYPADPEVRLQVLGYLNRARQQPEFCRLKLTAGGRMPAMGTLLGDESDLPVSLEGPGSELRSIGLLFGSDQDQYTRERWTFVTRGLRYFLIKVSAPGMSRQEAEQRLANASDWIDELSKHIVIE